MLIRSSGSLDLGRDIKGANLLVDASGVVKLADFGMAKHVSSHYNDQELVHRWTLFHYFLRHAEKEKTILKKIIMG